MQLPKITEYQGIRVLTTSQIATMYGTDSKTISYNFSYNKKKYIEGKHYIKLEGTELKTFKASREIPDCHKYSAHLYLWTEKGALLHAKSLNTDKAWEVYDYLVDFYFRAKEKAVPEKTETKLEPAKKPSGREVVDVPENIKIQKAIMEVKKHITALDVTVEELNKYHCEANYRHLKYAMDMLWIELGRKITDLEGITPDLVVKEGY